MSKMTTKVCTNCNKTFPIRVSDVTRGRGRFCGKSCASSGKSNNAYKHGNSTRVIGQTKEYKTWAGMKQRVTNPNTENGHYYQDRGIAICERWATSFENFLADMGEAPSPKHSIDRIDNERGYEPDNCRWATHQEQMWNTRATKMITYNGMTLPQEEWGRVTGLGGLTILKRLKRGWSISDALTKPNMYKKKTSSELGVSIFK